MDTLVNVKSHQYFDPMIKGGRLRDLERHGGEHVQSPEMAVPMRNFFFTSVSVAPSRLVLSGELCERVNTIAASYSLIQAQFATCSEVTMSYQRLYSGPV